MVGLGGDHAGGIIERVAGEVMFLGEGDDVPELFGIAGRSVGPFDLDAPTRFLGGGIEADDVDFARRPACVVEVGEKFRIVEPLAVDGGFRESSHGLIVCGEAAEEGGAHGGIGEIDLERGGAFEAAGAAVDALDAADQEGGFEILDVAAKSGFCHAGGLGKLFQGDFVAGVVGQCGEQAVQLLDVADAVELGQVAEQHLVDDVALDEALRGGADGGVEDRFRIAADVEVLEEGIVERFDVGGAAAEWQAVGRFDQRGGFRELEKFVERERWQEEIGEAAGTGLVAF